MKITILTFMIAFSFNSIARPMTEHLSDDEIDLAISLSNKYEVPTQANGPCVTTKFSIASYARGIHPATWTLKVENEVFKVQEIEISKFINLQKRLNIPSYQDEGNVQRTEIIITGSSCDLSSYRWTVTYYSEDPAEIEQWWLKSGKDSGGANIEKAWSIARNNFEIKVAVIDYDFDLGHEDLKNSILINENEIPNNGIDDDGNGYIDDYYGYSALTNRGINKESNVMFAHGTACLGIIGAEHNNGIGMKGTGKNLLKLIPIEKNKKNVSDDVKVDLLVKAFNYAIDRGADVINYSQALINEPNEKLDKVFKRAENENVIIVMSAGNDGLRLESGMKGYPLVNYAKKYKNIIIVANSTKERVMAEFSNYGENAVHVFAPGDDTYTTDSWDSYQYFAGTSASAPVVSGVVGLILATHGKEAAATMRERLINTSHKVKALRGKAHSNGIIDAYSAINWTPSTFSF